LNKVRLSAGIFRRYDHGAALNLKHYGTPEPPSYDLAAITVPVSLHIGDGDSLIPYEVRSFEAFLSDD
jgi:hypothetical protein